MTNDQILLMIDTAVRHGASHELGRGPLPPLLQKCVESIVRNAVQHAYGEAAMVAEDYSDDDKEGGVGEEIATRIRALADSLVAVPVSS